MEFVWSASMQTSKRRTSQDKSSRHGRVSSTRLTFAIPCVSCRTRKKRCFHTETNPDRRPSSANAAVVRLSEQNTRESSPGVDGIGVYAPESILEDISSVTGPQSSSVVEPPARSFPRPFLLSASERSALAAQIEQRRRTWCLTRRTTTSPNLSEAHWRYLQDGGAYLELPASTVTALLPLYICMLDDLVPLLDGPSVVRGFSNGACSRYLVRAICLVTCKLPQAAPHLRLNQDGPVLTPARFASKILAGLEAAIGAGLENDRVTKIQILALMHLHNDGRNGRERASKHLSAAINEAWATALHQRTPGVENEMSRDMLWWSLRNLDRLSKPVMGVAPYFIDDADIGIDRISGRHDSYRLSLMSMSTALGDLMTAATKIHKASAVDTTDSYLDFPSLTEITTDTGFAQFYKPHRAYFEIWYHLAAMLSCRHGSPGTVTYTRRLESAEQVVAILGNKGHEDLPPLPLVPYTLSMATSVIYRALVDRQKGPWEAHKDISSCCDTLDDLSDRWSSAKGISRLAKRLLKHITLPTQEVATSDAAENANTTGRAARAPPAQGAEDMDTSSQADRFLMNGLSAISDEDFNDALLDVELGRHFGDQQAFGNFQDMGTANFLDYLNMSYTEDEVC